VTQREPHLPRMLDVWFGRAFSRSPSGRFGSAKEMAAAFDAASRDEPLPSVPPDSVSLPSKAGSVLSAVARLSAAAPDITPGAVNLRIAETRPGNDKDGEARRADDRAAQEPAARATRPEDRTTKPEPEAIAQTAPPAQSATETPRRADTPLTMHEPTLAHGTVTHIEATGPRRTKLYGALIAAVAIGGALTVGLLSRGDENAAASGAAATSPSPTAPLQGLPAGATSAAAAPTDLPAAAGPQATAPEPAASAQPAATPNRSAAASASGTPPKKKKKERGF